MKSRVRMHTMSLALAALSCLSTTAYAGCKVHYDEDYDAMFTDSVGEYRVTSVADRMPAHYYDEDINMGLFDVPGSRAAAAQRSTSGVASEGNNKDRSIRFYDEDVASQGAL